MAGTLGNASQDIQEQRTTPASIIATLLNPEGATRAQMLGNQNRTDLVQGAAVRQLLGGQGAVASPGASYFAPRSIDQAPPTKSADVPLMGQQDNMRVLQTAAPQAFNAAALQSIIARAFPVMPVGKDRYIEGRNGVFDVVSGQQVPGTTLSQSALGKAADDLRSGRITADEYNAIKAKENYVPDLDPLNRASKEAGQWVESKDAYGNPIVINKLTGATKSPADTQKISDDNIDAQADLIGQYRKKPPSGAAGRSPFWLSVMDKVNQNYPDYNEQFYNSSNAARTKFSSGKEGTLVRSANVAVSHLETLKALGDALNNGDTQAFNVIKNKLSDQLGGVPIAGYEAAAPLVGDEVAKFILGGNSALADREKFAAPLTSARGGPQRQAAINSFQGLLVGQLHGLKKQYESETKSKDFLDKLDPDVAALLQNPQYAPGNNPNLPVMANSPAPPTGGAAPAGVPQGAKQGLDRQWYVPDPQRPGKYLRWVP